MYILFFIIIDGLCFNFFGSVFFFCSSISFDFGGKCVFFGNFFFMVCLYMSFVFFFELSFGSFVFFDGVEVVYFFFVM